MKKASVIVAGILLAIIVAGLIYLKKQRIPEFDIIKTIPADVAFFIDIHDADNFAEKLTEDNNIWEELKNIDTFNQFSNHLHKIDSLIKMDETLKENIKDRRIILAGEKIGKSKIQFLLSMKMENLREQKHLEEFFNQYALSEQSQIQSKMYNNTQVHYIEKSSHIIITYAFIEGVLLVGNNRLIVEEAIRQTGVKTSISDIKNFRKVSETAGKNVEGNIYINYSKLPDILKNPANDKYSNNLDFIKNFANWSALDINIEEDALLLNGFSAGDSDESELMDLFKNQEPVDQEIEEVLPANTATFINLGISDKKQYLERYKNYLLSTEKLDNYKANQEKISKQFAFNAEEKMYDLLHEEIGIAFLNGNAKNPKNSAFIILKTKGKRFAENSLGELSKQACTQLDQLPYKQNLKIDEGTSHTAYKMPINNLIGNIFGSLFNEVDNSWFTIIDKFVVFGKSPQMLQQFIYSNILNKTLVNDPQYKQFDDYLSNNSNFHFYSSMYRSPQLIANYLNESLQKGINENVSSIRKFQAFAYQFIGSNDMIYNNLFIKYIPKVSEEPKTVWECHLDTTIKGKPAFVTNHYTGEKEIVVQDLKNKIYLINKVGRVLWKKQLDEKINSEIYQIDFYKNGKLQMLFSTRTKMHLIDREGNYVERYPINFPSPSTAGLAVFDYDNNKDYRIFVPCSNKRVYDYNKEGKILQGWAFDKTDTRVNSPVQHFRVGTKDYIVFADQYRVYILNRRGEVRVKPEKQFTQSKNNHFILEEKNARTEPRLVTTSKDGTVYYLYFDGQVKTNKIDEFTTNHYFDYRDMNSDDLKDLIFLDENKLEVYESNGKKLFSREFDSEITDPPIYFHFSYKDRKLGIVSEEANEIYLLNGNGEIYDGFPLKGNTPFSIGYLDTPKRNFNLIVGNKYSFVFNYSVN